MKKNDNIILRRFVPSDTEEILHLFRLSVTLLCKNDYSPSQIAAWVACADGTRWQKEFSSRHTTVAVCDGKIAGFCDCESSGHIDRLYVLPGYERRKIGSLLLEDAENSHSKCTSFVESSLTARPFFEKHGYTVSEEQKVFRNGEYLTNFKMYKKQTACNARID